MSPGEVKPAGIKRRRWCILEVNRWVEQIWYRNSTFRYTCTPPKEMPEY